MSVRAYGFIPDRGAPLHPVFGSGAPFLVESAPVASIGVSSHLAPIAHQRKNQSCVGEAIASALYASAGAAGNPIPVVSPGFIWWMARAVDGEATNNIGTQPRHAWHQVTTKGFVPEAAFPRDTPYTFAARPDHFREAVDSTGVRTYAITQSGAARSSAIRRAIASGYAVTLGIRVDDAFEENKGQLWQCTGESRGLHYVFACGYDKDALVLVNSWGSSWGDGGFAYMAWDAVERPQVAPAPVTSSVYAVAWVPT